MVGADGLVNGVPIRMKLRQKWTTLSSPTSVDRCQAAVYVIEPTACVGEERRQGLVNEVTRAIYRAYGTTNPESGGQVYCLIHEIPGGYWRLNGQAPHLRDVLPTLGLDPSSPRYKELKEALRLS
jgi:phenylpyruvate tautomerase PptA (4-oxalocrotonate tautomerase family)